MSENRQKELTAKIQYVRDTRKFHRYEVVDDQGQITGSVYLTKQMNRLPKRLTLEVVSKRGEE